MGSGIFNLVVGVLCLVGASQGYGLFFTDSPVALYVAGGIILGLGVFQIVRARRGG